MSKFWKISFSITIAVFIFSIGAHFQSVVFANEALNSLLIQDELTEDCVGLDIVFLIDQSGSMQFNDLHDIRSNAIRTAIDILGDNTVYFCPEGQHRISVLGYGSADTGREATVEYIDSVIIAGSLEDLPAWREERKELKEDVPTAEYRGATDHLSALKAATDIIDDWKKSPIGDLDRKRMVLLMTDGGPCPYVIVDDEGNTKCDWREYGSRSGYLEQMIQFTDPNRTQFPWKGEDNSDSVSIWAIAFNDAQQGSGYRYLDTELLGVWQTITQNHGGDILILPRRSRAEFANTDLTGFVANVLGSALGSELTPWDCSQPIWVDPYLNDVTIIHIFRRGANPGVQLQDVNVRIRAVRGGETVAEFSRGKVIQGSARVDDYTRDGPNERYVFYLPPPGMYLVETDQADICRDLDVRLGTNGVQGEIDWPPSGTVFPQFADSPYYDPEAPEKFHFKFLQQSKDGEKVPLEEVPDFPLAVAIAVKKSGDTDSELIFYSGHRVDLGSYESEMPISTQYPGDYTWEMVATTDNIRSEANPPITTPIEVLRKTGTFSVVPVELFDFFISSPEGGETRELNSVTGGRVVPEPVDITVSLKDDAGNLIDPTEVLQGDLGQVFRAMLVDPRKNEQQILLEPDPAHPGLFLGTFNEFQNGAIDIEGIFTLRVEFVGGYDRLHFTPEKRQDSVHFNRFEVKPLDIQITVPSRSRLHEAGFGCIQGNLNPMAVELRIIDAMTNEPVELASITTGDPTQLFDVRLHDHDGNTEPIPITVQSGAKGDFLQGVGGLTLDSLGTYQLVVNLSQADLTSEYAWLKEIKNIELSRYDDLETNPVACQSAASGFGLIVLVFLGILIYFLTGGPTGSIQLITPGTEDDEILFIKMGSTPRYQTKKSKQLAEFGIKSIRVSKTSPIDTDVKKAINVIVKNQDGLEIFNMTLQPDEPMPFIPDSDIVYRL